MYTVSGPCSPHRPQLFRAQLSSHMNPQPGSAFSNLVSWSFYLQPIRRLKGKPENAFDRKAAHVLALQTSSALGAPGAIRHTVHTVARAQLPPGPVVPGQSSSTPSPAVSGSMAPRCPVLTLPTQSKTSERNGTSVPGNLGTYFGMAARFSPTPQVLTTPGFPSKPPRPSTSVATSSVTREPRGDV